MIKMNLKEFISNNKEEEQALETIRCGSCKNSLLHCGEYEIIKVGPNDEEGEESILCETCKKYGRNIESEIEMVTTTNEAAPEDLEEEIKIIELDSQEQDKDNPV